MSDSIKFGTLNRDGTVTNERSIKRSTIMACPHFILLPEHYRDDGTCRCDEEREQRLAKRRKPILTAYAHDNRWSPGASGVRPPEDSPAAYSARWIDLGSRADIVPDRQGFAYNEQADRDRLIRHLEDAEFHTDLPDMRYDAAEPTRLTIGESSPWFMWARRSGGYIYVDAWLTP